MDREMLRTEKTQWNPYYVPKPGEFIIILGAKWDRVYEIVSYDPDTSLGRVVIGKSFGELKNLHRRLWLHEIAKATEAEMARAVAQRITSHPAGNNAPR